MTEIQKILLIIASGLLAVAGYSKAKAAIKAKKVSDYLNIDIRDFSLSPIGFNLYLGNQTNESLEITKPVIEIFISERSVAYSSPSVEKYTIKGHSTQKINISFKTRQTAFGLIARAVAAMGKGFKISAKYTLYANGMFVSGEKIIA